MPNPVSNHRETGVNINIPQFVQAFDVPDGSSLRPKEHRKGPDSESEE
jgi:hypothetical protein